MNTRILMIASASFMALIGFAFTFLPQEILNGLNVSPSGLLSIILQITGAVYLGFSMLNWMAKGLLIDGIYARPIAMANFLHFIVAGLALFKGAVAVSDHFYFWIAPVLYLGLAVCFGWVVFTHPSKVTRNV